MESNNFRIVIDLSNFFSDYRSKVKLFITENVKTIKDIKNKLVELFEIDGFYLTSENHYLPPSEDIRIVQPDEILCAVPKETTGGNSDNTSSKRKSKKRKAHNVDEQLKKQVAIINIENKKRKYSTSEENNSNFIDKNDTTEKSKKKNKNRSSKSESNTQTSEIISNIDLCQKEIETKDVFVRTSENSTLQSNNYTDTADAKKDNNKSSVGQSRKINANEEKEYTCKGNLASYVKKQTVPTNTHEYLTEKPINIVRIDIVKAPQTPDPAEDQMSDSEKHTEDRGKELSYDSKNVITDNSVAVPITKRSDHNLVNSENNYTEINENQQFNTDTNSFNPSEQITNSHKQKPKYFFFNSPSVLSEPNGELKKTKLDNVSNEKQKYKQKYFTIKSPCISPVIVIQPPDDKHDFVKCEKIMCTPLKYEETSKDVSKSEGNEIVNREEFCGISNLLSSNEDSIDSSVHKTMSPISGLQELHSSTSVRFSKPKQISGVGHVLQELKTQHSSPYNTTIDSECSEVTPKRKRKRVRKRKTKSTEVINVSSDTTSVSIQCSDFPLHTKGGPSLHVKFEYDNDDENVKVVNLNADNATEPVETNNAMNKAFCDTNEENILKAATMDRENEKPQIGNIIAFKILRISDTYTPEVSSFITGIVVDFEDDNVVFDIVYGLDQCQQPSGKFSVEDEGATNVRKNNRVSFNWASLLNTRLLAK